jgi:hypothetical protein
MTGLLRGGPYDGLQIEIDSGQRTVDLGGEWLVVFGARADNAPNETPNARYVFRGEVTSEGLGVYEMVDTPT